MNKEEFIRRYGEAAWDEKLEQSNEWNKANPEKAKERSHEQGRKGGRYYLKHLEYNTTGLRGERHRVRSKHGKMWRQYKRIIAPDSVIHHEWVPETANYKGVALVEIDQHQHGIIDVIKVLAGKIKVFTEKELQEQER